MEEHNKKLDVVVKEFEEYFQWQLKEMKKDGYEDFKDILKDLRQFRKQIEFLQNQLYILEHRKPRLYLEDMKSKEKIRLMEKFGLKDVQKGYYGLGFFDALKVAEKHYEKDQKIINGGKE